MTVAVSLYSAAFSPNLFCLADNVFISTFLLTFRSFTTLDEVFDCLVKRFYIEPPAGLEPDQLKEWLEKKQQVVRFRYAFHLKFQPA